MQRKKDPLDAGARAQLHRFGRKRERHCRNAAQQPWYQGSSIASRAGTLSGGNKQKLVLAKWLAMQPKIMIFDEPTRGIDIGAKAEIYRLMHVLADAGVAVLMISSDMEEVIGVSDRVAVCNEGQISGILMKDQLDQENVLLLAVGKSAR
ncbi:ABC-type sugar transport system ATPase subunit [Phyllobacterium endophyticum]|nr:ABC-type sugar transport system ATPase subunit [Phyllobacterium endophyticum]